MKNQEKETSGGKDSSKDSKKGQSSGSKGNSSSKLSKTSSDKSGRGQQQEDGDMGEDEGKTSK